MFDLKGKIEELKRLKSDIRTAVLELNEVEGKLNTYKQEVVLYEEKISKLRVQYESEERLNYNIRCKKLELENIGNEIVNQKEELELLKIEVEVYKLDVEEEKKTICAEAEKEVKDVETKCQKHIDELSRKINKKNEELEDVTKKLNDMERKYAERKRNHKRDSWQLDQLQCDLRRARMEIAELDKEKKEVEFLKEEKEELEKVVSEYNMVDTINISEVAETPKYEFANSSLCKDALKDVRNKQEVMLKDGTAIISSTEWTVGGSKVKGRKMVNDTIKMMIKSFNSGCDHVIGSLKYNTYDSSLNKIEKLFAEINRLNATNQIFISNVYKRLKIDELDLAFKYAEMKEEEKEEQRIIREQMREEAKRREELENMRKKIEKEQKHYENELARALEKQKDAELIRKLREKIAELENGKKDVEKAEATVKAGYVYIISNEGSFGEDVYKIGTTRRLNPFDRVDELGNASVPFRFDVHAMIFSEDCFELETKLHKIFDAKRVNKVNKRKEFFNVSLDEIVEVVNNQLGLNVEFTLEAIAKEYKESRC